MKPVERPETDASESTSSTATHPIASVGTVIKMEKSLEIVEQLLETDHNQSDGAAPPQPPPVEVPHPQQPTPKTITIADVVPTFNCQTKDSTPTRVTRSREKTNSTPLTKTTSAEPSSIKKPRRKSMSRESQQSFRCKHCGYSTAWKCNFARHLLIHNDGSVDLEHLQCEHCVMPTKSQAKLLLSNCHLNVNEHLAFECQLCTKTFATKDLLDTHHMTVHRHQCPKCKKKFANEQQTDAHEKRCMIEV